MFSIVFPSEKKYYHKHSSANFRTSSWNSIQISGIIKQALRANFLCMCAEILQYCAAKPKEPETKQKKTF